MPMQLKSDTAFTVSEAAEYLGYSENTVRKYITRELIAATKFGVAVMIKKSECDRFRKQKRSPGRPAQK